MLEIKANLMLEGYQAFVDAIRELENERDATPNTYSLDRDVEPVYEEHRDYSTELSGPDAEAADVAIGAIGGGIYDPYFDDEDFPGRRSFNINEIDPEDPAFWSGRELGIPIGMSVHYANGQDKLFPVVNGKFTESGE